MDKIIQETSSEEQRFPKSNHIELGSDGWLSPKGDYYKCKPTEHDESAIYLVSRSEEAKEEERARFGYQYERKDYDQRNDREKLKELGWILIRGPLLHSEDALNYSHKQIEKIDKTGIKIISAFDGSIECSTQELLDLIEGIKDDLIKSKIINGVKQGLVEGKYSPWFAPKREKTLKGIEDFKKDPFHTVITTDEVFDSEHGGEQEVLPMEIFNILSKGYSEEAKMFSGRTDHTFRVIDLSNGIKLWVERSQYTHDGISGGLEGDFNNRISAFVTDKFLIKNKLLKLITSWGTMYGKPEIALGTKDGYFAVVFADLVPKP